MLLLTPTRRTAQPIAASRIAVSAITKDLKFAWNAAACEREAVSGAPGIPGGSTAPIFTNGRYGRSVTLNSNFNAPAMIDFTGANSVVDSVGDPGSSYLVVMNATAAIDFDGPNILTAFGTSNGIGMDTTGRFARYRTANKHATANVISTGPGIYGYAGIYAGTNTLYVNGLPDTTWTDAGFGGGLVPLNHMGGELGQRGSNGISITMVAAWSRVLSAQEMMELYLNPWQIFAPAPARMWFAALISAQLLLPTADVAAGAWISSLGGSLFTPIGETTPNDADYDYTTSPSVAKVTLATGTDPLSSTGHVIHVRAYSVSASQCKFSLYLADGTTLIAEWTDTLTTGVAQYDHTLTAGQADAITNYAGLQVWLTAL